MKVALTVISLLGVSRLAAAQTGPVDPTTIDPCVLQCVVESAPSTCSFQSADHIYQGNKFVDCICGGDPSGNKVVGAAAACVYSKCGAAVAGAAIAMAGQLCKNGLALSGTWTPPGVPDPNPPAAPALSNGQVIVSQVNSCLLSCTRDAAGVLGCTNAITQASVSCGCGKGTPALIANIAPCVFKNCPDQLNPALALLQPLCSAGIAIGPSGNPLKKRSSPVTCPMGYRSCKVPRRTKSEFQLNWDKGDRYECIDVLSNLESCGGCPGVGGIDCSTLPGVADVSCYVGRCIINECEEEYKLVNGRCRSHNKD